MLKDDHLYKFKLNKYIEASKNYGVKLTYQRMEIYKELAKVVAHPNAEEIYNSIKDRLPSISLDTVYRTLWLLNDLSLIKIFNYCPDSIHFETNLDNHYHFICNSCNKVTDIYSKQFDELKNIKINLDNFIVLSSSVELRGLCSECKKKRSKNERR